jgi:hypothetical protein
VFGTYRISSARYAARFADYAKFIRALNDRVAPLIRVMEQATSSEPALKELRSQLRDIQKADCRHWIDQLGPRPLRPGLSTHQAVDVMSTINTPYVYSLLTVDGDMTADDYEQWLAHAQPPPPAQARSAARLIVRGPRPSTRCAQTYPTCC